MTIIWFNLLLLHAGSVYWLGAFETLEQCQAAEAELLIEHPKDQMVCRWVKLESI